MDGPSTGSDQWKQQHFMGFKLTKIAPIFFFFRFVQEAACGQSLTPSRQQIDFIDSLPSLLPFEVGFGSIIE